MNLNSSFFFQLTLLIFSLPSAALYSQEGKLKIEKVKDKFYVFSSSKTYTDSPFTAISANGMYVVTDDGIVLFDTPFDSSQFQPLLDSIQAKHKKNVVLCIATHSHDDRTNGLDYYKGQNIITYTTKMTDEISKSRREKRAAFIMPDNNSFAVGEFAFEVFYPGPGHTPDNIVVWFERDKILYGGCFIKSVEAKNLGNMSDANLGEWENSIRKVIKKFKHPKFIITGHQFWRSTESLQHTITLIRDAKSAQ